jgi:hypothetical protein
MEMVDIGSLAQGQMESAPSKAKDPSETITGLRQSHNLYPIHHFVSIMLGDQNHFVTRPCQCLGLLMEDAGVKRRMDSGEMATCSPLQQVNSFGTQSHHCLEQDQRLSKV